MNLPPSLLQNFNWIHIQSDVYGMDMDVTVQHTFNLMYDDLKKSHDGILDAMYQRPVDEETNQDEFSALVRSMESAWLYEQRAIAAMALALMASRTITLLDVQKEFLNKTHPPDPNGYRFKSDLQTRENEYQKRFNIELSKIPGFDSVREVVLARNCCLHRQSEPDDNYLNLTAQRLLDPEGKVNLTPDTMAVLVGELKQFSDALAKSLDNLLKVTP